MAAALTACTLARLIRVLGLRSPRRGWRIRSSTRGAQRQETGNQNQVAKLLAMAGTSMVSCATSSTNGPATETDGGTVPALTPLNRRKTRMAS